MSNLALKGRDCRITQMMDDAFDRLSIPRAHIGVRVFPFLFVDLPQCDTGNLRCSDR
jgi:hypothetical protein